MGDLTRNFSGWEFDVHEAVPAQYAHKKLIQAQLLQRFIDDVFVPAGWTQQAVIINSFWRSVAHNKFVGGGDNSAHLEANAADAEFRGLTDAKWGARDAVRMVQDAQRAGRCPKFGLFMVYANHNHAHISPPGVHGQYGLILFRRANGSDMVVSSWQQIPAKKAPRQ